MYRIRTCMMLFMLVSMLVYVLSYTFQHHHVRNGRLAHRASAVRRPLVHRVSAAADPPSFGGSDSKLPLPFMDIESIGLVGKWVEQSENFVLKPQGTPIGVIHFLGGAFVGAAPHLTYKYLLESLSQAGYVIVATPYRLSFDYVETCDAILNRFDKVAVDLAGEYGALPVIGLGHSCGALLQTLITSLFPDAPRALNILISFNNRPVSGAIPAFEEVMVPVSQSVMGESQQANRLRNSIGSARSVAENMFESYAASRLAPRFVKKEILPLYKQAVEVLDQVPPLLDEIAKGTRDFTPSPADTKEACRRMYRARRTLLLKFENDDLDESEEIESVLREANTIMRMKRPMVEMSVELRKITGTHVTPLTQDILLDLPEDAPGALKAMDVLKPQRQQIKQNFLMTVNEVSDIILNFLGQSMVKAS